MKRVGFIFLLFFSLATIQAQKNNQVLVSIDGNDFLVADFKRVYEKNLDAIEDEAAKDVQANLELFINYKLKVNEALRLRYDTIPAFINEIQGYRNQLSAPYLQDTAYINRLVRDAYFRIKNEVKAKHILIEVAQDASPEDTLKAYQKITDIRNTYLKGESSFESLAVQYSDDPSAKGDNEKGITGNQGDLGYFSAFQMVFPFEEAAYKTQVNEVSQPFRTKFGYHIVKVDDLRKSEGEVEIAHILVSDKTQKGRQRIQEVYDRLNQGEVFRTLARKYSDDTRSKSIGGKLRKFGRGRMLKPIEEAAYALKDEGDYSAPFLTKYGWHIVQLIKKFPIPSFDDLKMQLERKIRSSARAQLSKKAVVQRLKNQYSIKETRDLDAFLASLDKEIDQNTTEESFLFSINGEITQKSAFVNYLKKRRSAPIRTLYNDFKDEVILEYYEEHLEEAHPDFAHTIQEYREGLLLFELMQEKIWNRASNDSEGLERFYKQNKINYAKPLSEIKGQVVSDYQDFLESEWIKELRSKSAIQINQKVVKKLVKYYQKNA